MKQIFPLLKKRNIQVLIGIVLVLIIVVGAFFSLPKKTPQPVLDPSIPREKIPKKVVDLIGDVEKTTPVPENEIPNIATVKDVSRLSGQVFFAQAQNGDKVLMYSVAKKAFLYRPSTKKIINVAPIEITTQASESASTTPSQQNVLRISY